MASANDMFQKVGRATATTLSAPGYTTGDSSVNIGSTTNWPTDTGVTFAIDVVDAAGERIAGTYNVFRGRVAGASQVDQVVYEGGDAHRSYPSGATTRVYILVSSYRDNRMADGLMISHNQDGTIKGPSVVTALTGQTLPADTVTTPAIVDASVTVGKLTNPYKFCAYRSAAGPTVPAATWTTIVLDAEEFDTNSDFNTANGRFTAPLDGYYQIDVQVALASTGFTSGANAIGAIYKNGSSIIQSASTVGSGSATAQPRFNMSRLFKLTAGDYLEIKAYISEGGRTISNGINANYMSGHLVSLV